MEPPLVPTKGPEGSSVPFTWNLPLSPRSQRFSAVENEEATVSVGGTQPADASIRGLALADASIFPMPLSATGSALNPCLVVRASDPEGRERALWGLLLGDSEDRSSAPWTAVSRRHHLEQVWGRGGRGLSVCTAAAKLYILYKLYIFTCSQQLFSASSLGSASGQLASPFRT